MRKYLIALAAVLLLAACFQPTGSGNTNGPTPPHGDLVLDEEFNGTTLNQDIWNYGWAGEVNGVSQPVQSQETACYTHSQVTVSDGSLHLAVKTQAISCGGKTRPYTSSNIQSRGKFTVTPGSSGTVFVEARVWLPSAPDGQCANWPAVWLDGISPPSWPDHGELDLLECLSGDVESHWHGPSGQGIFGWYGHSTGWHTYGAEWTADHVTGYVDGVKERSYTSASNVVEYPQFLIAGMQMSPPGQYGGPVVSPTQMMIDYVRVWKK